MQDTAFRHTRAALSTGRHARKQCSVSQLQICLQGRMTPVPGTDWFLFCAQQSLRTHLSQVSAHVHERGNLPPSQFAYESARDRLRCP